MKDKKNKLDKPCEPIVIGGYKYYFYNIEYEDRNGAIRTSIKTIKKAYPKSNK